MEKKPRKSRKPAAPKGPSGPVLTLGYASNPGERRRFLRWVLPLVIGGAAGGTTANLGAFKMADKMEEVLSNYYNDHVVTPVYEAKMKRVHEYVRTHPGAQFNINNSATYPAELSKETAKIDSSYRQQLERQWGSHMALKGKEHFYKHKWMYSDVATVPGVVVGGWLAKRTRRNQVPKQRRR
jgi:hypothetical protein